MSQGMDGFKGLLDKHRDVLEAEVARVIKENEIRGLEREDLLQTCRIAAWVAWPKLLSAKEPPALLRTICSRALKDYRNKLSRDLLATAGSLSNVED